MSFLAASPLASGLLRRSANASRDSNADVERQRELQPEDAVQDGGSGEGAPANRHEREASGRSILSNISGRLATMRERERETERNRQMQRANAMAERLLGDLNHWRVSNGRGTTAANGTDEDLEAQLGQAGGNAGQATDDAAAAAGVTGLSSMRKLTGKSRREREEGAMLFGPNLANYFGSGSSSSGAVAGSASASAPAQAQANTAPANAVAVDSAAAPPISPIAPASPDINASSPFGSTRRPRLGSRGRARGASLSGLNLWSLNAEAIESVNSLGSLNTPVYPSIHQAGNADGQTDQNGALAMAEGIEIDSLKRWIERSRVGGAMEIASAEEAGQIRGDVGNPTMLCSTLQSYVNLKRNTIKMNSVSPSDFEAAGEDPLTVRSPITPFSPHSFSQMHPTPASTHTLQFDYDCAAPFASVQVFIRSSRKHGSWLAWQSARETLGMPIDLTIGADDDGESRFLGQRGPPPHVLGWPIHCARVKKGFNTPLKVNLALRLELYAPPKVVAQQNDNGSTSVANEVTPSNTGREGPSNESNVVDVDTKAGANAAAESSTAPLPTYPPAVMIPETPGLNASRRLEDPVTPAVQTHNAPNPMDSAATASAIRFAGDQAAAAPTEPETKEAKLARDRAERETLKVAVVIEALDEEGKPLREPNLQTTYIRLASLPIKQADGEVEVAEENEGDVAREALAVGGPVLDVALSPTTPTIAGTPAVGAATVPSTAAAVKRAWSVQVEGQEAEIGPHRFQLQELYGLSTKPPPPQQQQEQQQEQADERQENEGGTGEDGTEMPPLAMNFGDDDAGGASECLICLSAPPTTLLLPCTHGLCIDCAIQLRDTVKATRESERRRGRRPKRKYACPVCRRIYTSMLHLSAVDEKYVAQAAAAV